MANTCKRCNAEVPSAHWEKIEVLSREPGPGEYFQTPLRTWRLRREGKDTYMVGNDLYCAPCYEKRSD